MIAEQITKACKKCGCELPLSEFRLVTKNSAYRRNTCIRCENQQMRDRHHGIIAHGYGGDDRDDDAQPADNTIYPPAVLVDHSAGVVTTISAAGSSETPFARFPAGAPRPQTLAALHAAGWLVIERGTRKPAPDWQALALDMYDALLAVVVEPTGAALNAAADLLMDVEAALNDR